MPSRRRCARTCRPARPHYHSSTGYADQYEIPDPVAEHIHYLRPLKPIVKPIIARWRAEIYDGHHRRGAEQ